MTSCALAWNQGNQFKASLFRSGLMRSFLQSQGKYSICGICLLRECKYDNENMKTLIPISKYLIWKVDSVSTYLIKYPWLVTAVRYSTSLHVTKLWLQNTSFRLRVCTEDPGACLNIKMSSYQSRNSHTWKDRIYNGTAPRVCDVSLYCEKFEVYESRNNGKK